MLTYSQLCTSTYGKQAARLHLPGCLDCPVNVLLLCLCHLDQHLASARVLRLKSLPAGGVHKLAINQQLRIQSEEFIIQTLPPWFNTPLTCLSMMWSCCLRMACII